LLVRPGQTHAALTALSSNSREDGAKLKWHGVRCLFEDAQSDILLFLDTCSLRDAPLAGSHGLKQAIAAWGPEHHGRDVAGRTFTSILVHSLQKFGAAKNPFSAQNLYDDILQTKQMELAQNTAPLTNGAGKPHPGTQLPIFFTLTPGKGQSLSLSPLSGTGPQPLGSPRKAGEGEADATKSVRDQIIHPEAVHELQFDHSRVLACTTFVGEASPDMAYFNKWLDDMPAIADQVAVEAMFFGPPTMLLISMALPIWEVVRHDKVCIFLGYIGSHNFVHLYQRLVGSAGVRPASRLPATKEEDGRILLEARELASTSKRPRPEDSHDGLFSRFSGPPPRGRDDNEDSAEMKEAAEQLKALSHIRSVHVANESSSKPQRSSLPDSAPHPHSHGQDDSNSSNGANESGGDEAIQIVDYNAARQKQQQRRSLNKTIPKHETRCTHCSHAPFKDSSSLRKHVAAAHTRPFPCAFSFAGCTSTFGSKNEWKRHISSQHLCLQYYRCSACPATASEGKFNEFNRKDLFTQHLRRMHAPFAIKKSLTKVDSKLQLEWEAHVKEMQQTCLVQRRQPPQRSACPKPDCQNIFEGPGAWDEWTEHVGRHMEKNEGGRLGVDRHLAKWALEEGIIERDENNEYKLVQENGFGGGKNNADQTKDSISVAQPPDTPTKKEPESPEDTGEAGGDGDGGEKMDVDE
jgi:hypothetical protein